LTWVYYEVCDDVNVDYNHGVYGGAVVGVAAAEHGKSWIVWVVGVLVWLETLIFGY
jgi:hypothetical protein